MMGHMPVYTPHSSNVTMEEFFCDCESCLSFNFEKCTWKEDVAQTHNSVENGDDSWLQDDENGEKTSQIFEFVEIPSYVALISDNSSEPVYFVKVEAKEICEKIMTDTYDHTLSSGEKYFWGKYLQKARSRKSNKKQFQFLDSDVFVTPYEVFEALMGFCDKLRIDNKEYLHLIEHSMIW